MNRIVKLIATDNRYKTTNYPFRCVYHDGMATYITGQHIDPDDPETRDNLTLDEMTLKVKLSAEKQKRFPYIINPLLPIQFYNNQTFDLTKNPDGTFKNSKDAAIYNLLKKHVWFVAEGRNELVPRQHYYYIHDEIAEAERRVVSSDLEYQAEKYIREDNTEKGLRDVALMLSYKLKDFDIDIDNVTPLILKDRLLQVCKKSPDKILECTLPDSKEELFILKLAYNNIITRRGTDFFNGSEFIGKDLLSVRKYMKLDDKASIVSKWSRLLLEKEGHVVTMDDDDIPVEKQAAFNELSTKTVDELKAYAGTKRYPKIEHEDFKTQPEMLKYLLSKIK